MKTEWKIFRSYRSMEQLNYNKLIQSPSEIIKPRPLGGIKMDLFRKWPKEDASCTVWMYGTHWRRDNFLFFQAQFSLNKSGTAVFFYKIQLVNLFHQLILHFTDACGRQLQTQRWVRSHKQNGKQIWESRFGLMGWTLGARISDKLLLFSAETMAC